MQIGNIELEWKGHSGFLILTNELKIYIDPFKLSSGSGENKADIILITHSHYDHCSIEDLSRIAKDGTIVVCSADCQSKLTKLENKIKIQNLEPGEEKEIEGIRIKAVPAYNIDSSFILKLNTGMVMLLNLKEKEYIMQETLILFLK